MRIGIIGSMQFTEKMLEVQEELKNLGHDPFLLAEVPTPFIGKSDDEKEQLKLKQKKEMDTVRYSWDILQGADAVLVLNLDKRGIKNYIGGNSLLEIAFAYILKQKIFLYNDIPDISYYKTEIESLKPVIIYRDLNKIM